MIFSDRAVLFLATGFYAGRLPVAPGTFGSLIGLLAALALTGLDLWLALIGTLALAVFSIWIAHEAERILNQKDPGCIVIDEIAGMTITLVGLPFNLQTTLLGFVFFRIFDILKPPPISTVEKRLGGGVGVVADDVIAGIMANLLVRIVLQFT